MGDLIKLSCVHPAIRLILCVINFLQVFSGHYRVHSNIIKVLMSAKMFLDAVYMSTRAIPF